MDGFYFTALIIGVVGIAELKLGLPQGSSVLLAAFLGSLLSAGFRRQRGYLKGLLDIALALIAGIVMGYYGGPVLGRLLSLTESEYVFPTLMASAIGARIIQHLSVQANVPGIVDGVLERFKKKSQ